MKESVHKSWQKFLAPLAEGLSGIDILDVVMRISFLDADTNQSVLMANGQTIAVNFCGIEWRESFY